MDVAPDKEALFNEVYDTEHIPYLPKVPGVHAVTRVTGEHFALSSAAPRRKWRMTARATAPFTRSTAPTSCQPRVGEGGRDGRSPDEVRPLTHNRRHALFKVR